MASHTKHQTTSATWQAERLVPTNVPWHKRRMIDEHMARYQFASKFVKGKKVMDLACGTGYGCALLAEEAARVSGIDNNKDAIEYAKKHYNGKNISYHQYDVTKTLLANQSADVITSFETVEHIAHDKDFIKEVRRLLKPNGLFIMSTPNVEFSTGTNPYHIHEYTRGECEDLLKDFKNISLYGQRKVNRPIFNIIKSLPVAHFRPWESVGIQKIQSKSDTAYCYFIFVCS